MEYNYFLLLPITVMFAWVLSFINSKRYLQVNDRIVLALLTCCGMITYITLRALLEGTKDYGYLILDNIESFIGLFICPLLFLYIRTVAHDSHWHKWYYWLFAPGVVIGIAGTILSFAVGWDRILEVRGCEYAPFTPADDNIAEQLYRTIDISLFNISLEVMALILIGQSIIYLMRYHRHLVDYYADLEDAKIKNANIFLVASILFLVTIFTVTLCIRKIIGCSDITLLGLSLWMTVLFWVLSYNAYKIVLTKQNIEVLTTDGDEEGITATSSLAGSEEKRADERTAGMPLFADKDNDVIAGKVTEWQSRADKPFCKGNLTLTEVAKDIQVNPRLLSVYINKEMGMNFNRWINTLRVEEAKHVLLTSPDDKIGHIAAKLGFSDQPAFTNVFRTMVGSTPQAYRIHATSDVTP